MVVAVAAAAATLVVIVAIVRARVEAMCGGSGGGQEGRWVRGWVGRSNQGAYQRYDHPSSSMCMNSDRRTLFFIVNS